jgi:hypothetical protein
MLAVIADSELALIPDATHGAPIEFPLEIADRLLDFLHRRVGYPAVEPVGRPASSNRRARSRVRSGPPDDGRQQLPRCSARSPSSVSAAPSARRRSGTAV